MIIDKFYFIKWYFQLSKDEDLENILVNVWSKH